MFRNKKSKAKDIINSFEKINYYVDFKILKAKIFWNTTK